MTADNTSPGTEPDATSDSDRFAVDERVELTVTTNMLDSAGPGGAVVCVLPSGTTGSVIDGPVDSGNLQWLRISTSYGDGWVMADWLEHPRAEGNAIAGGTRLVTTTAMNLRDAPGTATDILYLLPSGVGMTVLEGPIPKNGFDWYRADVDGYGTGWLVSAWLREA